ncbi:MAG: NifU family protein [Candidatus Eisenbacteria bacterium]|uniref:NifU family protein n=1 Tax=Eiseniibacteriota bacterium TaxID=2212470 RepID=A0A937XAI5_UNCEI|nr:NifU family protein [Candidatus Eisenbacteria bacterium]
MDRQSVEQVIEDRVKPALVAHGGGIELVEVKEGKVFVRLTGACGTCPMALMTLKSGVERALKQAFPELIEVVSL